MIVAKVQSDVIRIHTIFVRIMRHMSNSHKMAIIHPCTAVTTTNAQDETEPKTSNLERRVMQLNGALTVNMTDSTDCVVCMRRVKNIWSDILTEEEWCKY